MYVITMVGKWGRVVFDGWSASLEDAQQRAENSNQVWSQNKQPLTWEEKNIRGYFVSNTNDVGDYYIVVSIENIGVN